MYLLCFRVCTLIYCPADFGPWGDAILACLDAQRLVPCAAVRRVYCADWAGAVRGRGERVVHLQSDGTDRGYNELDGNIF